MTDPFTYKIFREEWRVEFIEVDQYDKDQRVYESVTFPTKEEAWNYWDQNSIVQQWTLRRVPINPPHGYCRACVTKHLVEVPKIGG